MRYWKECLSEACEDIGIVITNEQLESLTGWVEGAHENYGMATGEYVASRNLECSKNDRIIELENKLKVEKNKRVCPDCKGRGEHIEYFVTHVSVHRCRTCGGEGKI